MNTRLVLVLQATALASMGCRSESPQTNSQRVITTESGGHEVSVVSVDAGAPTSLFATQAQCSAQQPEGMFCEVAGEQCGGSRADCSGEGPMQRCSGAQWTCQCSRESAELPTLKWTCSQQMHAAGPLAPPELLG